MFISLFTLFLALLKTTSVSLALVYLILWFKKYYVYGEVGGAKCKLITSSCLSILQSALHQLMNLIGWEACQVVPGTYNKVSGFELFRFKSIPRWKGDVITTENDIDPKKGVTKELKPPGQHLKTNGWLLFAVNKLKCSCYVLLAALNMCCRLQTLNLIIIFMTDSRVSCRITKAKRFTSSEEVTKPTFSTRRWLQRALACKP